MELRDFAPQTVFFFLILMQYVSQKFDPNGLPLTNLLAAFILTGLLAWGGFFDGIAEFMVLILR